MENKKYRTSIFTDFHTVSKYQCYGQHGFDTTCVKFCKIIIELILVNNRSYDHFAWKCNSDELWIRHNMCNHLYNSKSRRFSISIIIRAYMAYSVSWMIHNIHIDIDIILRLTVISALASNVYEFMSVSVTRLKLEKLLLHIWFGWCRYSFRPTVRYQLTVHHYN